MRRIDPAAATLLALIAVSPAYAQDVPVQLDTVHVTVSSLASAELATATRAVQVITAAQIRSLPASTIPDVLRWAVGVDVMPRSPALTDVSVRGGSFEQLLVMVDGVRVSDAQTGHFDLDLAVPLDQVERVEILRGAASALHGADAVGGVINIVTRGGSVARVEAGSFGTGGLAAGHTLQTGSARLDVGLDLRRSEGHRDGTDYRTAQGRVALTAGRLAAAAAWAGRDFGARGFYGSNPDWDEFEETRAATATVALRGGAVEPVLSFRRHDDEFLLRRDDPAFYRNRHTTEQLGGQLVARRALAPMLSAAAGAEAFYDRLASASLGDRAENRAALLAELAAGRPGSATATAGLRADWHEARGGFLSPSASAAWWPTPALSVRASIGRALRTPTWTERYYRDPANVGNADLASERSWSEEVGLDFNSGPMSFGLSVFQRRATDLIDWSRPAGSDTVWITRNVNRATFRGIEAQAGAVDLFGTRWSAQGSWLAVTSSTPAGMESKYALRPLAQTLTLGADRPWLSLRLQRARRVGERAYFLADARASVPLRRFRLFAEGRNLTDTRYLDIVGTAAGGRHFLIGLEARS